MLKNMIIDKKKHVFFNGHILIVTEIYTSITKSLVYFARRAIAALVKDASNKRHNSKLLVKLGPPLLVCKMEAPLVHMVSYLGYVNAENPLFRKVNGKTK